MTDPKRHHYLPQFYLREFTSNELVAVYDRPRNVFRTQPVHNTAVEKDFYTVTLNDGQKNRDIETLISTIEGDAKPVITSLINSQPVSEDDRVKLSLFIALLIGRTPEFDETFRLMQDKFARHTNKLIFHSIEETEKVLVRFRTSNPDKPQVEPEEMYRFIQEDRYNLLIPRERTLLMMLELSMKLSNYFWQMDWTVFHAPAESTFITSDAPFITVLPPPKDDSLLSRIGGIATPGARKMLPLSSKAMLVISDQGSALNHRNFDRKTTRAFNENLAVRSFEYLYGDTIEHLKHIVSKTKLNIAQWEPKMKIGIP